MTSGPQHLFLVRHGQTALNAAGRLRGLADPPLDATGITEALAVSDVLAGRGIVAVYSSPLERARHTAQIIAYDSGAEFTPDARFNDRDYGPWTGHVKADVIAEFGSVDDAPGVEPVSQVLDRARPALDAVLDDNDGGAVVVVTHDAVIRPLLAAIDPAVGELAAPTGSWNELVRDDGRWSIVCTDQKPWQPTDEPAH